MLLHRLRDHQRNEIMEIIEEIMLLDRLRDKFMSIYRRKSYSWIGCGIHF